MFRCKGQKGKHDYILVYYDVLLVLSHTDSAKFSIVEEPKSLYKLRIADDVDFYLGVQLNWATDPREHLISLNLSQL